MAAAADEEAAVKKATAVEEAAAVEALRCLPRRQLLLYANSLQALCFNRAASFRLEALESAGPMAGDLVWAEAESTAVDAENSKGVAGVTGGAAIASAGGAEPEGADGTEPVAAGEVGGEVGGEMGGETAPSAAFTRAAPPPRVRVLSAAEASSGRYSLSDVLLPLPGHSVAYPEHGSVGEYARVLAGLGLECPRVRSAAAASEEAAAAAAGKVSSEGGKGGKSGGEGGEGESSLWYCPGVFDLPGGYRPLVAFASDVSSTLVAYSDHTLPLEAMDADALEEAEEPEQGRSEGQPAAKRQRVEPAADGAASSSSSPEPQYWAWKLAFSLPASVYATMLLREVLHEPLDLEEHARRSKALLARKPIVR